MDYNWLRALHIIAFVTWFAGLFYIFRLFVYHVENRDKPEICALLETMERRLYRGICWPALLLTSLFGVLLWARSFEGYLAATWFQVKLVGIVFVFAYHLFSGWVRKRLAKGQWVVSSLQCRLINEAPTVLLILIVIMAVVKPG